MGMALVGVNSAFAAIDYASSNTVDGGLRGKEDNVDKVLEGWITYLTGFLYLIAIAMILWGAFNILTAAGDEDKVKKGKTVLMQAVAGLIVVFLANSIILWVLNGLFGSASGT